MKALLLALLQLGSLDAPKVRQYVVYAAEQQVIPAGKHATLELRFHVIEGYHINSHLPKSDLLLPTQLELTPDSSVRTSPPEYPAGHDYNLPADPPEKLDVYSGDFIVRLPVTATAGPHEIKATLKYQACNNAACYPPKQLPITVPFTTR